MGSVCTLMSTEYHSNHWDIIPKNDYDLELYETNRYKLHKTGFKVCEKRLTGQNCFSTSLFDDYYGLFCSCAIEMVTTSQGSNEWHFARPFAFTSSTISDILVVLNHHNIDWPEFQTVRSFYSKTYQNEVSTGSSLPTESGTIPKYVALNKATKNNFQQDENMYGILSCYHLEYEECY